MPPAELTQLVYAPDVTVRNQTISAHLRRMETELERTRTTVASLHRLLEGPPPSATVTFRTVPATRALGIRAIVSEETGLGWVEEAHHELRAALAAAALRRAGPDSALFAPEIFEVDEGEITAYIPVTGHPGGPQPGRVAAIEVPAGELAVVEHAGPADDLDQAYASLGRVVSQQSIGVTGPLREHYLIGPLDTEDTTAYRTEVGWPVFRTTEQNPR